MIAGDHDDADTGPLAILDGARHVGARGIFQRDETHEGKVPIRRGVGLRAGFHGAGQHTQTLMAEKVHAPKPFVTHGMIECDGAVFGDHAIGGGQHRFRCALDREQECVATTVNGRHHLRGGIEGILMHDRAMSQQDRALQPVAEACAQQRQLHRIAAAVFVGAFERGIVAQHRDFKEQRPLRVVCKLRLRPPCGRRSRFLRSAPRAAARSCGFR